MMGGQWAELNDLTESQLDQLASLHQTELASLISDLGTGYVRRFYSNAASVEGTICMIALEGQAVVGAIVGTDHPNALLAPLARPVWRFLPHVLLRSPKSLVQLVHSYTRASEFLSRHADYVELMYVVVDAQRRGAGLGTNLIEAFVEEANARGFRGVTLSVEIDNAPAIAVYEKLGFEIQKEVKEGKFSRYRMLRILN